MTVSVIVMDYLRSRISWKYDTVLRRFIYKYCTSLCIVTNNQNIRVTFLYVFASRNSRHEL